MANDRTSATANSSQLLSPILQNVLSLRMDQTDRAVATGQDCRSLPSTSTLPNTPDSESPRSASLRKNIFCYVQYLGYFPIDPDEAERQLAEARVTLKELFLGKCASETECEAMIVDFLDPKTIDWRTDLMQYLNDPVNEPQDAQDDGTTVLTEGQSGWIGPWPEDQYGNLPPYYTQQSTQSQLSLNNCAPPPPGVQGAARGTMLPASSANWDNGPGDGSVTATIIRCPAPIYPPSVFAGLLR